MEQVCRRLRTALNITLDQTQFKSNQKSLSTHTKPCNMVITLQGKSPKQAGAKENEAGLDQSRVNMVESCERVCRAVWYVTTGDRCTLCSGTLPTWRGSGTFGRAVGVWLLQEVTVEAALTWSTQSQHIPMMQGEGRGGLRAGARWGWGSNNKDWSRARVQITETWHVTKCVYVGKQQQVRLQQGHVCRGC